jgi:hypothetical protein
MIYVFCKIAKKEFNFTCSHIPPENKNTNKKKVMVKRPPLPFYDLIKIYKIYKIYKYRLYIYNLI